MLLFITLGVLDVLEQLLECIFVPISLLLPFSSLKNYVVLHIKVFLVLYIKE